jgi:hypothetical protein
MRKNLFATEMDRVWTAHLPRALMRRSSPVTRTCQFFFRHISTPQRARFELKVPDREKYNATINLNTSRKHSNTLMAFARHLGAASGNLKLPLQAHVKITRVDNKEKVLELTTDTEELYASSPTQLSFRIQSFTLEKGEYDVEVENISFVGTHPRC